MAEILIGPKPCQQFDKGKGFGSACTKINLPCCTGGWMQPSSRSLTFLSERRSLRRYKLAIEPSDCVGFHRINRELRLMGVAALGAA
jgi:hypothetical protein